MKKALALFFVAAIFLGCPDKQKIEEYEKTIVKKNIVIDSLIKEKNSLIKEKESLRIAMLENWLKNDTTYRIFEESRAYKESTKIYKEKAEKLYNLIQNLIESLQLGMYQVGSTAESIAKTIMYDSFRNFYQDSTKQ